MSTPHADSPSSARAPGSWEIAEALSVGVKGLREHWRVLIPATLIVGFLTEGLSLALNEAGAALGGAAQGALAFASVGTSLVLGAILSAGMLQISLDTARGTKPRLASLLERADRALPLIAAYILTCLTVFAGTVAFIVPGIIAAVGLSFAPMLVVDRKLSGSDALGASWELVKGHKAKLFAFSLACAGLVLTLMVPMVITANFVSPELATALFLVPITIIGAVMGVAHAWIYSRLSW